MWNGILNIYKEKGYTSHDVVAKLRGIVRQKKIGHTGTLDPDAEGVLPVCLGKATRLCDMLTDQSKTYEAVLLLGKTTDTQDITGQLLEEQETGHLTEEDRKRIDRILSQDIEPEKEKRVSLGIRNVDQRLKMIYGADCGLFIDSDKSEHTVSTILLKMEVPSEQ